MKFFRKKQHTQNLRNVTLSGRISLETFADFDFIGDFSAFQGKTLPINFFKLMDVNVWGVARVTTAMLPLMRHTGGRIVVMASGLGRIMQPSRSPYGKIIPFTIVYQ